MAQDKKTSRKKKRKFGAETSKVLKLVIHSLYKNKDIFLRELVSNSSDACDKLRFEAQKDSKLTGDDTDLKIIIKADKEARTMSISDNGIGMDEEDLINNLGTIARSGTQEFIDKLGKEDDSSNLIGQFGVGFYSSFMVADKVEVISRKAGEKQAYKWVSQGDGDFTVEETEKETRGTTITLYMREDQDDYLDKFRLQHIVKTYSDHVSIPIIYVNDNPEPHEEAEEQFNTGTAIWMRQKSEITEEQYNEFYKTIAHQVDEPFLRLHGRAEGIIEYNYLLFIPTTKPFDLYHPDRMRRLKLFVRRVFIAEDNIDVIPRYLRFMRGVVDSEDLPLNVSRETLQENPVIDKIRTSLTKKILGELKKKAEKKPEEYELFWKNFGPVLKEGLCESLENREQILGVCKFNSTNDEKLTSLDEYIERVGEEQKEIYYLSGENLEAMRNSPQLEGFTKRGLEVLLFTDSVDDFWIQAGHKYKDKEFKSVTRSDIDLGADEKSEDEDNKTDSEELNKLIEHFKTELGESVKDVRVSKKLESSPVCLAIGEGDMDIKMERFLLEQKQLPQGSAKILEINPSHALINRMSEMTDMQEVGDLIHLLFDQALIQEGESISDIKAFSDRLNKFLGKAVA